MSDLTKTIGMSAMEAQDQRVETMILEPTAFSQSQVKFLLPQQGLLSEDAFLTFKMGAAAGNLDSPFSAGGLSALRRCAIYYDNTLLAETDAAGALANMKQYYVDQHIRDQTYQTKTGGFTGLKVDQSAAGKRGMFMPGAPRAGAAAYGNGIIGLQTTEAAGAVNVTRRDAFKLNTNAADSPEWTIPLKWLFNFISQLQIPLGLLNGRVSVVIDWAEDLIGIRTVVNKPPNTGSVWTAGSLIDEASCKLSVDLIYYDDAPNKVSPMERIQAQLEKGIELVYTDYIHVEEFIPALKDAAGLFVGTAPQVQTKTIRLNLDHQIIRNILMATPKQADYAATTLNANAASNCILGDFNSCASMGETTLQVKINNQNLYVNALDLDCKIYNELSQVLPTPFRANVGLTSNVGQVAGAALTYDANQVAFPTDKFVLGHLAGGTNGPTAPPAGPSADDGKEKRLTGSAGYMGVNLSRTYDNVLGAGTSVGKAPVEIDLTYTYTNTDFHQKRVLVYAEVERMMMIKNGTIYVSGS